MMCAGEFAEWAKVYDNYYGTSKEDLETILVKNDVLLDIDVQGTKILKGIYPDAISIFVVPPSIDVLKERLIARRTDSEEEIMRRLEWAKEEIMEYKYYNYVVQNEVFEETTCLLDAIIRAERCRTCCLNLIIKDG